MPSGERRDPERWKPIPGWTGLYEVSSRGRVRSLLRQTASGMRGGQLLRTIAVDNNGYPALSLCRNGQRTGMRVGVAMALAFIGPRPPGNVLRHLDDDPLNLDLSNLAWGTPSENEQDKLRNGGNPMANRTHCANGHEFSEINTRWSGGWRVCKKCVNEVSARQRAKKKAEEDGG